jgi:protein TonB
MTSDGTLPRRFGSHVLTARLTQDSLGTVYRALRISGERGFVRLRILETEELSEDAVLDAIEEYGEIHGFLKNPAIAREVEMDSVGGVPFISWNEESGRTLDALLARTRSMGKRVPIEHALLIAEKVATALDHAYNTTVDGERTLHGLVWPGFVSITDDGETRLTGFGLAPGVLPSLNRPQLAGSIGPYLAPEERGSGHIGRNADVYSVGAILFELLTGRLPSPADPLGDLRTAAKDPGAPIAPELAAILRMCLSPTETRYQSSGELRRELGKLLFSGPYAPSTFNLAFYLSGLFGVEIEAENRGRAEEASLDAGSIPELDVPSLRDPPGTSPPGRAPGAAGKARKPLEGARRGPWPLVIWLLAAAAVAGGVWVVFQRSAPAPRPAPPTPRPSALPAATPTAPPASASTSASTSTSTMSEAQFKEEVARRLGLEMKRLEQTSKAKTPRPAATENGTTPSPGPVSSPAAPPQTARSEPTPAAVLAKGAAPEVTEIPARASAPGPPDASVETPPKISSIVKPVYPLPALRARIGGVVILRVLVGETGTPLDIEVLRDVAGGLGEAAVTAVRRWKFEPARRSGTAVRAWTTIPIPFEP